MELRKSFYLPLIVLITFEITNPIELFSQSEDSLETNDVISLKKTQQNDSQMDEIFVENKQKTESSIEQILKFFSPEKILWIFAILVAGFVIIKFLTWLIKLISRRTVQYKNYLDGSIPVIRLIGWGIILYIILVIIMKVPDGIIISIAATISIAAGLAAQDLLKNIFSGIMILFERTFHKGDKIKLGDYYGKIIKIGLRATSIKTEDDSLVTIPNSEIMNKPVSNSNYGELNCQVVAEIYLPVDIDTTRVREIAIETAKVSRHIYLNKPVSVLFINEVKGRKSYLKMRLKAYVMDLNFEHSLTSEMTEIVIRELLREGLISKDATV